MLQSGPVTGAVFHITAMYRYIAGEVCVRLHTVGYGVGYAGRA